MPLPVCWEEPFYFYSAQLQVHNGRRCLTPLCLHQNHRKILLKKQKTNVYWALAAFNKGWITQTYNSVQHTHNTIEWY